MIYVCVTTRNNARTVGLVLWKLRKVFTEFPREYHVLVADDASADDTATVLESYQGALPMTITRSASVRGYARTIESLLRAALDRTDRPKRDLAVTLPADFSVSPAVIQDVVRSFESGADVIVTETTDGESSVLRRLVRRSAGWLLRPGVAVPGVSDYTSGVCGIRLVALRSCLRDVGDVLLSSDGPAAFAELLARTAVHARQVTALPAHPLPHAAPGAAQVGTWELAFGLLRAGRRVHIPSPSVAVKRL